jgi:hypothetical protein
LDIDIIMTALKLAQDKQLKATSKIVFDDCKEQLLVMEKKRILYRIKRALRLGCRCGGRSAGFCRLA